MYRKRFELPIVNAKNKYPTLLYYTVALTNNSEGPRVR